MGNFIKRSLSEVHGKKSEWCLICSETAVIFIAMHTAHQTAVIFIAIHTAHQTAVIFIAIHTAHPIIHLFITDINNE
jgi:hypothetical protein